MDPIMKHIGKHIGTPPHPSEPYRESIGNPMCNTIVKHIVKHIGKPIGDPP